MKLSQKTAAGKALYLVQVPVNTADSYGFRDQSGNFLEFELTKPLALMRSYPDPIYYGYHPAGLPSNVHVVGITLEEGSFGYEVKPQRYGHVFERPDVASYTVPVTSHADKSIEAKVTLQTRSFDGRETASASASMTVEPGKTADIPLSLPFSNRNGWHELKIVIVGGSGGRAAAKNTLSSSSMLPPNTRTYGDARFLTKRDLAFGRSSGKLHADALWIEPGHAEANRPAAGNAAKDRVACRVDSAQKSGFFDADILRKFNYLPKRPTRSFPSCSISRKSIPSK